jgi:hypothetical protein
MHAADEPAEVARIVGKVLGLLSTPALDRPQLPPEVASALIAKGRAPWKRLFEQ